MLKRLAQFARQEDGASTVDWIVLTATMIGLALAAVAARGARQQSTDQ